jgi:uncharacterized membrane protein YoaK (UPF0700 family)
LLLTVLLACAMGIQNATARQLGVPDATTTVLTLTLTGLARSFRSLWCFYSASRVGRGAFLARAGAVTVVESRTSYAAGSAQLEPG